MKRIGVVIIVGPTFVFKSLEGQREKTLEMMNVLILEEFLVVFLLRGALGHTHWCSELLIDLCWYAPGMVGKGDEEGQGRPYHFGESNQGPLYARQMAYNLHSLSGS